MPGLDPRLSGLDWAKGKLSVISDDWGRLVEESIDGSPVHEVGAHETSEGERAFDGCCGVLSQPQQQEGDEGDSHLDTHGILGGAEEVADLEGLLDPAEEQLDLPAAPVEVSDLLGRGMEIVGEDTQLLAGLGVDAEPRAPGAGRGSYGFWPCALAGGRYGR
jgi:hypothetical protein